MIYLVIQADYDESYYYGYSKDKSVADAKAKQLNEEHGNKRQAHYVEEIEEITE
ncbi:MAG: hypothetical protein JRC86_00360 [Deltaproteobacteria bacterium]|nr:hypothetical protein [Deltaproteobacteria bacterium]